MYGTQQRGAEDLTSKVGVRDENKEDNEFRRVAGDPFQRGENDLTCDN